MFETSIQKKLNTFQCAKFTTFSAFSNASVGVIFSKPTGHPVTPHPCLHVRCLHWDALSFSDLSLEWNLRETFLAQETMEEIWGIKSLRIENLTKSVCVSLSLSLSASPTSQVQISYPKTDVRKCELPSIQIWIWIALKWKEHFSPLSPRARHRLHVLHLHQRLPVCEPHGGSCSSCAGLSCMSASELGYYRAASLLCVCDLIIRYQLNIINIKYIDINSYRFQIFGVAFPLFSVWNLSVNNMDKKPGEH